MDLKISIESFQDGQKISLSGHLSDASKGQLQAIVPTLSKNLVFNFRNLQGINSTGAHDWLMFMQAIVTGRSVTFEECSPAFVMQMNLSPLFFAGAMIKSILGDCTCQTCGKPELRLFSSGENLPSSKSDDIKLSHCIHCGGVVSLDEGEDVFFAWLENVSNR